MVGGLEGGVDRRRLWILLQVIMNTRSKAQFRAEGKKGCGSGRQTEHLSKLHIQKKTGQNRARQVFQGGAKPKSRSKIQNNQSNETSKVSHGGDGSFLGGSQ